MGCGCKKKTNEAPQPAEGQATATVVSDNQTTQEQTQEKLVQVAVALREMIENKEL
jgi:hypothetical protein